MSAGYVWRILATEGVALVLRAIWFAVSLNMLPAEWTHRALLGLLVEVCVRDLTSGQSLLMSLVGTTVAQPKHRSGQLRVMLLYATAESNVPE
jgi:hypothetical protein